MPDELSPTEMGSPGDAQETDDAETGFSSITVYLGVTVEPGNKHRLIVVGSPRAPIPMVTIDERVLPMMFERAQHISNSLQKTVEILKYETSEPVRKFDPQKVVVPKFSMSSSMLRAEDLKKK